MQYTKENLIKMIKYHEKYGKRHGEPFATWLLRKRSINTAFMVTQNVSKVEFADFLSALYFPCDNSKYGFFRKRYESQLEEAYLNPDHFVENLDAFYLETCKLIEKEKLYVEFFDFCKLLEQQQNRKKAQGCGSVFYAYYSLLMQQAAYFCRERIEDNVYGISETGELMFSKSFHPFIDMGSFELEKYYYKWLCTGGVPTPQQINRAYKPYGYDVWDLVEVHYLEAITKASENNAFAMIPYISENTPDIKLEESYQQALPEFPRRWKETDYYLEKLKYRNYMLPAAGVTAMYTNAGDIKEIHYQEVFYNDEIVLLYRVTSETNGQHSGYFHTKSQYFYSIYQGTDREDWHDNIKNFVLENYMILTCDYEIDRKKNYAIRQVDRFEREFHYPDQPLVIYNYKHKEVKSSVSGTASRIRKYVKEDYQEEIITRSGYIRRLPLGQCASEEATQYAAELGLVLPAGRTFVRSHEFLVYRKITNL